MKNVLTILIGFLIYSCSSVKISQDEDKSYVYKELIKKFEKSKPFKDSNNLTRIIEIDEVIDTISKRKFIHFNEWKPPLVVLPEERFKYNFTTYNNRIYYWNDKKNVIPSRKFYNLLNSHGVALDSCYWFNHLNKINCKSYLVEIKGPIIHKEYEVTIENGYNIYK